MSGPVALDTNVLVRLLVNDDRAQAQRAAAVIDASPGCYVPIVALAEPQGGSLDHAALAGESDCRYRAIKRGSGDGSFAGAQS